MDEFQLVIARDTEDADVAEVLVDGTLGGRPYRFLLDTGAAKTSVPRDPYTSTFASSGTRHSSGVFAGIRDDAIVVPTIGVGSLTKTNWPVNRSTARDAHTRPLIGMDFLKDHRCHFLFDQQRVLIDPDDPPQPLHPLHDLFLDSAAHPYVDVHFGNLTAKTVWDTGAGITIADTGFIANHPALFQELGSTSGTDASGATIDTPLYLMAASIIGDTSFPPTKVAGVDLSRANNGLDVPMNLILGYTTLSKANWRFDFPQRKWGITKMLGPAPPSSPPAH